VAFTDVKLDEGGITAS